MMKGNDDELDCLDLLSKTKTEIDTSKQLNINALHNSGNSGIQAFAAAPMASNPVEEADALDLLGDSVPALASPSSASIAVPPSATATIVPSTPALTFSGSIANIDRKHSNDQNRQAVAARLTDPVPIIPTISPAPASVAAFQVSAPTFPRPAAATAGAVGFRHETTGMDADLEKVKLTKENSELRKANAELYEQLVALREENRRLRASVTQLDETITQQALMISRQDKTITEIEKFAPKAYM